MKELILHIGFSKCASSTIQTFLTNHPVIETADTVYKYCCFDPQNKVVPPDRFMKTTRSPPRYRITTLSRDLNKLRQQLREMRNSFAPDESVIISNEGLANPNFVTKESFRLFADLNVPIRIFMLTRPYVDWLNSSWWQWGCWLDDMTVNSWLQRFSPNQYLTGLDQWLGFPNVDDHAVFDISMGPIDSFCSFLNIPKTQFDMNLRSNVSSSEELLRFLINNKNALGRSIHKNRVEFRLNDKLKYRGNPPPFVVPKEFAIDAINKFNSESPQLLELISKSSHSSISKMIEKYTSEKAYATLDNDFSFEHFLSEKSSPDFLSEMSELFLNKRFLSRKFDPQRYLDLNPELAAANVDPYRHFTTYGLKEGRRF